MTYSCRVACVLRATRVDAAVSETSDHGNTTNSAVFRSVRARAYGCMCARVRACAWVRSRRCTCVRARFVLVRALCVLCACAYAHLRVRARLCALTFAVLWTWEGARSAPFTFSDAEARVRRAPRAGLLPMTAPTTPSCTARAGATATTARAAAASADSLFIGVVVAIVDEARVQRRGASGDGVRRRPRREGERRLARRRARRRARRVRGRV
mmetsp:Transcript_51830/g.112835  ORF Transcript_51830/g.112835 Transcript_51830/m.112835 type:complete len:212 (+) Transcript_51830:578-1213(+)